MKTSIRRSSGTAPHSRDEDQRGSCWKGESRSATRSLSGAAGSAGLVDLVVQTPPLYIQEKVHPRRSSTISCGHQGEGAGDE